MVTATRVRHGKAPALEAILSGVAADELDELKKTLRDREVDPAWLARRLAEYKHQLALERDFAPVRRAGLAFTDRRQRLRKRLLKILNETTTLYEAEVRHEALNAQAGYRAAAAMLAALKDIYDPIVGPSMGHEPKAKRGPKTRLRQRQLRKLLTMVKLGDHATFLLAGLFPSKKKK